MEKSSAWLFALAVTGSVFATAATLLQYVQANRAGQPGGYLPILSGALIVGLLVALIGYFATLKGARSALTASLLGVFASVAFTAILVVTLIWGFGS